MFLFALFMYLREKNLYFGCKIWASFYLTASTTVSISNFLSQGSQIILLDQTLQYGNKLVNTAQERRIANGDVSY